MDDVGNAESTVIAAVVDLAGEWPSTCSRPDDVAAYLDAFDDAVAGAAQGARAGPRTSPATVKDTR